VTVPAGTKGRSSDRRRPPPHPELPPSLISGGNLQELNASLDAARGVVAHVQQSMAQSNAASRIPPGAPARVLVDPGAMTSREKILYAVRSARGEFVHYGPIENHHQNGILDTSTSPASVPEHVAREAAEIANHASAVVVGKLGTATVTREELIASFDA